MGDTARERNTGNRRDKSGEMAIWEYTHDNRYTYKSIYKYKRHMAMVVESVTSVEQCWVNMDMERGLESSPLPRWRKSQAITPSLERERQGGERGRQAN